MTKPFESPFDHLSSWPTGSGPWWNAPDGVPACGFLKSDYVCLARTTCEGRCPFYENKLMTPPLAVCALILRKTDGHALAVARRKDSEKWGLPGGKVDPGETPIQAIIREVQEETGFVMIEANLVEIYRAVCPGEVDYDTITYFYDAPGPEFEDLKSPENLPLAYLDSDVLVDPQRSPFANYNRAVRTELARLLVNTWSTK